MSPKMTMLVTDCTRRLRITSCVGLLLNVAVRTVLNGLYEWHVLVYLERFHAPLPSEPALEVLERRVVGQLGRSEYLGYVLGFAVLFLIECCLHDTRLQLGQGLLGHHR